MPVKHYNIIMEQQDIKDIIRMLSDATLEQDWDSISDTIEQLKEYLDDNYI